MLTKEEVAQYRMLQQKLNATDEGIAAELEGNLRSLEYAAMNLRKTLQEYYRYHDMPDTRPERKDESPYNITAEILEGTVVIQMPQLLPHRREKPNVLFIEELRNALEAVQQDPMYPFYYERVREGAVLYIRNSYGSAALARDCDNIETKAVIDELFYSRMIHGDSGPMLSILSEADLGGQGTYLRVIPKPLFRANPWVYFCLK